MREVFIAFAFVASAGSAFACSLEEDPTWRDQPISVAPNGSFQHAEDSEHLKLSGGMIVDLGGKRVAQRITLTTACGGVFERLLFADCHQAEVVSILGAENLDQPYGWRDELVDLIQIPIGAIDVREITSAAELVSIAYENDYKVSLSVEQQIANMKRRNRYDPFNGCKIYYPESRGAGL